MICALSVGVRVLIPALDALSEFLQGAVMNWEPDEGCADIRAVLEKTTEADTQASGTMRPSRAAMNQCP